MTETKLLGSAGSRHSCPSRVVMSRVYMCATIISITVAFALLSGGQAPARDRRQNEPGNFAFYLLTLSWSPSEVGVVSS